MKQLTVSDLSDLPPFTWLCTPDGPVTLIDENLGANEPYVILTSEIDSGDWGSYHDNCSTEQLRSFIGNKEELDRLNKYRNDTWTQERLDRALCKAIRSRLEWEERR